MSFRLPLTGPGSRLIRAPRAGHVAHLTGAGAWRLKLAAAVLSIAAAASAQPRIQIVEGKVFDLGKVDEDAKLVRILTLKNPGLDTLLITSVTTSCNCTAAKLARQRISPFDTEKLAVTFSGGDIPGPFKREVYIATNDTLNPKIDIIFTGTLVTAIEAKPRYISFGTPGLHASEERTIRLVNTTGRAIRITSAKAPDSRISLRMEKDVLPPHGGADLRVTLSASRPGRLLGQIELRTSSARKPVVRISYVGHISKNG